MRDAAQEKLQNVREQAADYYERGRESAREWEQGVEDYIKEQPIKSLLIAAGVGWRKLDAEGADRFDSAGIHYACTSVEAVLYDSQDVAVVGGGNSAGQAAMFLAECCRTRTVHLLIRGRLGPSMSDYLVGRIGATPNIHVHEGEAIASVHGRRLLESVILKSGKTLWSGLAKTDGPRVKGRLLDGLREAYDQADKIRYKR